jgi:prepilin-type processing-associated H-X9-DG protein
MSSPRPSRLNRSALASFILGLLTVVGGQAFTGVPALWLGLRALRAIHSSDGQLLGKRLALSGMILGGLGTLATVLGLLALVLLYLDQQRSLAECTNHLRRQGIALARYQDEHNHFPPGTLPHDLPLEDRLSWLATLLPYLEEKPTDTGQFSTLASKLDLHQGWNASANAEVANTWVRLFRCPSARPDENYRQPLTSYVGLAGVGRGAAKVSEKDPDAGVFGYDRVTARRDVAYQSATLMVLETNYQPGRWLAGGPGTVRGVSRQADKYIGLGQPWGGLHPAGANGLFVDGSVRLISEDVAPEVFRLQVRIRAEGE